MKVIFFSCASLKSFTTLKGIDKGETWLVENSTRKSVRTFQLLKVLSEIKHV